MTEKDSKTYGKTYDEMLIKHPEFENIIDRKNWEFIGHSDKATLGHLEKQWAKNIRQNVENKLWKKHGGLHHDCTMIGKNKALIGVGAGQSFNLNKHVLQELSVTDGVKGWFDRNFIILASNHQLKPLLNMGIIPDFVMVADASDVVMDQLTTDIPELARSVVLIAGLHCSPKVLKRWSRQGREIRFYLTHNEYLQNTFEEATGEKNSMDHVISQGGNVLNSAWSIGLRFFKSSVYMALGNDLSYSPGKTLEDRRNTYYADGDYSTNAFKTGTGRDEAKSEQSWGGFRLKRKGIYTGKFSTSYDVELDVVHTTQTLWVYKIWLEANVLGNAHKGVPYHYYNCSEAGISGVMCRDDSDKGFAKDSNWYLMDEVCKRWKTRMFEDAIKEFVKAKEVFSCPEGILRVAQPAKGLVLQS